MTEEKGRHGPLGLSEWDKIKLRQGEARIILEENRIINFGMGDEYIRIDPINEVTEELMNKLKRLGFRIERS